MRPRNNKELLVKILSKTIPHLNGCWIWQGQIDKDGYAKITYRCYYYRVHRLMFKFYFPKQWKEELYILHKCDNTHCINPDHLFIGTSFDNAQDMISKERSLSGCENPKSVLNKIEVLEIRNLLKHGIKHKDIATKYNISKSTVSKINTKETYKNLC